MPRIRVPTNVREESSGFVHVNIRVNELYGPVDAIAKGDFAVYSETNDRGMHFKIAHVPSGMRVMSGGDMAQNPNIALRMLDELNAHAKFFSDFCERAKTRTLVDADFDRYSEICRDIRSRIAS
jgi:hypothetical protein